MQQQFAVRDIVSWPLDLGLCDHGSDGSAASYSSGSSSPVSTPRRVYETVQPPRPGALADSQVWLRRQAGGSLSDAKVELQLIHSSSTTLPSAEVADGLSHAVTVLSSAAVCACSRQRPDAAPPTEQAGNTACSPPSSPYKSQQPTSLRTPPPAAMAYDSVSADRIVAGQLRASGAAATEPNARSHLTAWTPRKRGDAKKDDPGSAASRERVRQLRSAFEAPAAALPPPSQVRQLVSRYEGPQNREK